MKHTKGPWSISTRNCPEEGYVSIDGVDHTALALVVWQMDEDRHLGINSTTCEANAELIAAAPDLLEALKGLYTNLFTDGFVTIDHMEKARAVIAKAEGL